MSLLLNSLAACCLSCCLLLSVAYALADTARTDVQWGLRGDAICLGIC
jgi:hypothetical protein